MARKPISIKVIKELYAKSGNQCEFPNCTVKLFGGDGNANEICHIEGVNPGSARYNPDLSEDEVNSISNLILLCPTHHTLVDKDSQYTVEQLKKIKAEHETKVAERMNDKDDAKFYEELTRIFQNCHFDEVFLRQSFDAPFNDKYFDYMSDGYYAIRELMNEECAVKIPGAVKKELLGMADLIEYMATGIAMCFDSNGGGFAIPNAGRWDKQNAEATEYNLNLIRGIYQKYRFR